jgi:hypothetical protein
MVIEGALSGDASFRFRYPGERLFFVIFFLKRM